jgi:DNA invertase Pin-like site-specific DNA recombinase
MNTTNNGGSIMKHAVGYMRVSTNGQTGEDAFGLEAQREQIIEYCRANDIKIVDWFVDEGVSGADERKPGLDAIVAGAVTNPPVEMVVTAKNDRISRKVEYYYAYKIKLQEVGISIVSVAEDFGRESMFTPILEALTAAMAEVERNMITARTSGGRKIKASKGGYSGGRTPYGYMVDRNVRGMVINEEQAEVVRLIFDMKSNGYTFQRIVDELNDHGYTNKSGGKWAISSVQVILGNENTYRGMYKYGANSEWVQGEHEPILN